MARKMERIGGKWGGEEGDRSVIDDQLIIGILIKFMDPQSPTPELAATGPSADDRQRVGRHVADHRRIRGRASARARSTDSDSSARRPRRIILRRVRRNCDFGDDGCKERRADGEIVRRIIVQRLK